MKNLLSILAAITVLSVSVSSCSNTEGEQSPTSEQKVDKTEYQCPMKCEGDKVYHQEISCPVCNMDLVEVAQG